MTGLRQGEEWIKARYHSITGTDVVGNILGCDQEISKGGGKKKLFETKAKEIDPLAGASPVTMTYLALGREFEKSALKFFQEFFFQSVVLFTCFLLVYSS